VATRVQKPRSYPPAAAVAALFVLALHAFAARPESHDDWIPVSTDHGVTTFRREVPGSGIVAVKGEGALDAPVWKVASVLLDTRRAAEWVDSLKESRVVRRLGPDSYIEYNHLHSRSSLKIASSCRRCTSTSTRQIAVSRSSTLRQTPVRCRLPITSAGRFARARSARARRGTRH
jgi:hypothetical protein